jgi:hypothetical protein
MQRACLRRAADLVVRVHLMSRFYCVCGVVTRNDEEPPGTSRVVYAVDRLIEIEDRIARRVAEFVAAKDTGNRAAWIESYFEIGSLYPADESDRGVVQDIVSGELDTGFSALFQCPACGRIAMRDPEADAWVFYSPEHNQRHP